MLQKMPDASWRINKDLLIYKSFYCFYFGALGAINPYLPIYFRQIGLSAVAVGVLVGIRPIIQLASVPFWTVVADKFKKRQAILVMSIMAWLVMTIALVFVEPTEEICEYTVENYSHLVFVNYTKHKTGFFKRSLDESVKLPTQMKNIQWVIKKRTNLENVPKTKLLTTSRDRKKSTKIKQRKKNSPFMSDSFHKLEVRREEKERKVFDPFNMNGKSKSLAGEELANFFASINNMSSVKSTDVHYYNMNRPERHYIKPNYTEIPLKKNMSQDKEMNKTLFHQKLNLSKSYEISKHENNTYKMLRKNLFKSNHNEMKRLFVILLVLIVVGEFLETPSAPLSDASLLEYLGENRIHYGKQRLWGSLGHGIASFFVGMIMERSRHVICGEEFIDYTTSFSMFTLFMLITLVISANFKFQYKMTEERKDSVFSTVFTIHYVSFLTAVCYMGMCHGLTHNFLMWFLEDLGDSKTLMQSRLQLAKNLATLL